MNRILAGTVIAAAALLIAGCLPDAEVDERATHGVEAADAPDQPGTDQPGTDQLGTDQPVCLAADAFVADGAVEVRDAGPGNARRIHALRWASYQGCERFVIHLVTGDGKAAERAGAVTAEVLRDLGVARVSLRDVEYVDPDATDATFDGPLATRAFVGRSPDGRWVFVDVHLGEAAEVHVGPLDGPARVVIDLRPGGPPVPGPAPHEDRVVVLRPRAGAASYPLRVTGYARTFEANVVVRLEQQGRVVHEDFTTATAWADVWGHFSLPIDRGPSGPVVLHVGEHSARDGTWEGVAIELDVR
jgi:hypothetical protein